MEILQRALARSRLFVEIGGQTHVAMSGKIEAGALSLTLVDTGWSQLRGTKAIFRCECEECVITIHTKIISCRSSWSFTSILLELSGVWQDAPAQTEES
jgi:hypothetical protein